MNLRCAAFAAFAGLVASTSAEAGSRAFHTGAEETSVSMRSLDGRNELHSDLCAFPSGLDRSGAVGDRSLTWTSRHGSVVASAVDAATVDGLNEKGLAASLLYLSGSEHPDLTEREGDAVSISASTQYMLDMVAAVEDAVSAMRGDPLLVATGLSRDGMPGTVHHSQSDSSGNSAIFEFIDGALVIHHSRVCRVMTNEPSFDKQLTLRTYRQSFDGSEALPGTAKPVDRFVRPSFFSDAIPKTANPDEPVANALPVIRTVSVPRGISTPDRPNPSTTLWRVAADHKTGRRFFDSATRPGVFRVDRPRLDVSDGAPAFKLEVSDGAPLAEECSRAIVAANPYAFLETDTP